MSSYVMKINFLKLFLLGEKREGTPKNGPQRRRRSLSGPLVFVSDTRVLTIMKIKNTQNGQS